MQCHTRCIDVQDRITYIRKTERKEVGKGSGTKAEQNLIGVRESSIQPTFWKIGPSCSCISTLWKAILWEDSKDIFWTVPFSYRLREDISCGVGHPIFHNITSVHNGNDIREVFPFKGEWLHPCGHQSKTIYLQWQTSWWIWFSYIGGREKEREVKA